MTGDFRDDCRTAREYRSPRVKGWCNECGDRIRVPRRTVWCSDRCSRVFARRFYENHDWNAAREAVLRRDRRRCLRCGSDGRPHSERRLEVNHIDPRVGRGYGLGCHNHLANLETLCHRCHVDETNRQRLERRIAS